MFFNFSFILYRDKTFFYIINKMITFLRLKICTAKKIPVRKDSDRDYFYS